MADSNQGTMSFIAETVAGTTPATPAFKTMRITSENPVANFETLVSAELNPNSDVTDVRRGGLTTSGEINFELHRDGGFEDFLAGALRGAWATNVLKAGTLKPSYTLERKVVGTSDSYFRFTGSHLNGFSLNFGEEFITGAYRVTGIGHTVGSSIISGATYTAPSTASASPPMTSIDVSVASVSGVTGVDFSSITIDVENNNRYQRKLASAGGAARGIGFGRRNITGTLVSYFETLDHYNQFLNGGSPSVTVTASDGSAGYTVVLPKIKITGGEVPNPGIDQDFMLTLNYQAVYDSVTSTSMQITRT